MITLGLIGYPLSHSFSQKYFTDKFAAENNTNAVYKLFPLETINQFPNLLATEKNLGGLNVTIPYKESIIPFLNEVDETAAVIGAVNCIDINIETMHTKGYNTDVYGFTQSVKPFLQNYFQRALILGTGGAAKAVYHVLHNLGIDCYFVSRQKNTTSLTPKQQQKLFTYNELNKNIIDSFFLIVNTTPLGMFPSVDVAPEIPYEYIGDKHLLYDLIYNPAETLFLSKGKQQGAVTLNGLDMLRFQADKSLEIWSETKEMLNCKS